MSEPMTEERLQYLESGHSSHHNRSLVEACAEIRRLRTELAAAGALSMNPLSLILLLALGQQSSSGQVPWSGQQTFSAAQITTTDLPHCLLFSGTGDKICEQDMPILAALLHTDGGGAGSVKSGQISQPEAVDVPAIGTEVEEWVPCATYASEICFQRPVGDGSGVMGLYKRAKVKHRSCEDSRRIGPLPSADGKWHCLYFGGQ